MIRRKGLNLARRGVVGQEIVLENLHAGETGLGNGRQFLREFAADGDGGDGSTHWHALFACVIARHIAFLFSVMY